MKPIVLLPSGYRDSLIRSGVSYGTLDFRPEGPLNVISGWWNPHRTGRRNTEAAWHREHFVDALPRRNLGVFYRVAPEFHGAWLGAYIRRASIPTSVLQDAVIGWYPIAEDAAHLMVTLAVDEHGAPTALAWIATREALTPTPLIMFEQEGDRLEPLQGYWPLADASRKRVVVAGVGSVGSAACLALLDAGFRQLALIDPDFLDGRNFARHAADRTQVGRAKVDAVAELLRHRDDRANIHPLRVDVIDFADVVRQELSEADALLVCVDGVEPRRVLNHLAVRAGVPAVFACVLMDGAVGEVLRVLPRRYGCLLCHRRSLTAAGVMDPEPALDRGYGTGSRHLPMTAVGSDLSLVGQLAAKALIATVLQRSGHADQRLAGEHAVIGLRAVPGLTAPYDVAPGAVTWQSGVSPDPACPTCSV